MILDNQYPQILKVLEDKKSFIIAVPATVSTDAQSAATSLYLALSKAGKQVTLVSEKLPTKEADIIALEKFGTELQALGGDTLTMSFPYEEGAVDKVSYDIEGDRFKLVIQPKAGFPKLDPKKVAFGYTGGKIDVIITVETARLEALGKLYTDNTDKFSGVDIINIDRRFNNAQFGTINVVEKQSSSIAEIVLSLLTYLKIELDRDIATNLYTGLVYATNNFTAYSVNADTFEIASRLLRAGALKKPYVKKSGLGSQQGQFGAMLGNQSQPFNQPYNPSMNMPPMNMGTADPYDDPYYDEEGDDDFVDDFQPVASPNSQQMAPQPIPQSAQAPVQQVSQQEPVNDQAVTQTQPQQTPSDWLKPKIFKGSSNLA